MCYRASALLRRWDDSRQTRSNSPVYDRPMARETLDLCGVWKFLPDPRADAELSVCADHAPDTRRWREALIPATFETCLPELDGYEGTVWFAREASIPRGWESRRVALRFEGVNHHTGVWVNGHEAGGSSDGFLPFEIELDGFLRAGDTARILVRVDNLRREPDLPGTRAGWRNQGGILREVSLVATDPARITEVRVNAAQDGGLTVSWQAINGRDRPCNLRVAAQVIDAAGSLVWEAAASGCRHGGRCGIRSRGLAVRPRLGRRPWSPQRPTLYRAVVRLDAEDQEADRVEVRFGFRTVQAKDGKLLLNGEPIYLQGWNRDEDSRRHGMASDLQTARADLLAMKEAGATFVRLCHYPHHPAELDLCDEIGLTAMAEIPLYWWAGEESQEARSAKVAAASRQLESMIRRDANHPSVVLWSVSNETEERRADVVDANRTLIRLARRLDPSRLAVHVSNRWQTAPHFEEDDVICVNGYPSVDGSARIHGTEGIEAAAEVWRRDLDTLHQKHPDKPVLVTELGFPAVPGAVGAGMPVDEQARVIEAELGVLREKPYLCGATIWCWADHLWPVGSFEGGIGVSPYGVLPVHGILCPAFTVARRVFRETPSLTRAATTSRRRPARAFDAGGARPPGPATEGPAGYTVFMLRHHLRDIPKAPLLPGYSMRPLGPGDAGLWTDVQRDAEPYFTVDDELFHREFRDDPAALAWRSFVALDERKLAVGVISAWRWPESRDALGKDPLGRRPKSHQGRGIGKGMLAFALEQLAQWHDKAVLWTASQRLPAIKLYLDFGFEPDLELPGTVPVWCGNCWADPSSGTA